jgi:hypothetical protein
MHLEFRSSAALILAVAFAATPTSDRLDAVTQRAARRRTTVVPVVKPQPSWSLVFAGRRQLAIC